MTPQTWDYSHRRDARRVLSSDADLAVQQQPATALNDDNVRRRHDRHHRHAALDAGVPAERVRGAAATTSVTFTNNRVSTDRDNATFNPCFGSGLTAQYTQPLLRNFKIDNHAHAARKPRDPAGHRRNRPERRRPPAPWRRSATPTGSWCYARQAVEAAQRSLDLASKLVRTTGRAWRSARWRRSTSCRRRRKKRAGDSSWSPRRRRCATTSSRSSG